MDQHIRAMHFVLYFNAIEVLDELKSMPQDDVVTALKEIGKRYEELLPYLLLTAHINSMKEAIEATKALIENKIAPKGDYEAQRDIRIDFFNAICAVQSAVMYIRKAYPNYEAQYPDLRQPVEYGNLEVHVIDHSKQARKSGETRIMVKDRSWHHIFESSDIKHLEAKANCTLFHLKAGTTFTSQFSLAFLFCEAYLLRRLILLRSATLTY